MSKKNYVDEKGNYHNIQNLTLAQIYLSGFDDGYMIAKEGKTERPQGDLISREALKEFEYINKGNFNTVEGIREWIDNAPTVHLPDFKDGYKQAIIDGKTNFSRPQGGN